MLVEKLDVPGWVLSPIAGAPCARRGPPRASSVLGRKKRKDYLEP